MKRDIIVLLSGITIGILFIATAINTYFIVGLLQNTSANTVAINQIVSFLNQATNPQAQTQPSQNEQAK